MKKVIKLALLTLFISGIYIYHSYVIYNVDDIYPIVTLPIVSYGGLIAVIYWIWSDLRS